MKKIMLLAAGEKGKRVLEHLSRQYKEHIGLVISFHETGVQKDWFEEIASFCKAEALPFLPWSSAKERLSALIPEYGITGILCVSWRYLIPTELNQQLQDNIVIFHDSLLPQYRGFAPVVTAMLCGEKTIGASALFAVDEADAGDIICQKSMELHDDSTIAEVISRMSTLYTELASFVLDHMLSGNLKGRPQADSLATYSIWRGDADYRIDWAKPAEEIALLVRAVGDPYLGAMTFAEGQPIRIKKASVAENDVAFAIRDPGKIWQLKDGRPLVVCGTGMLLIEEAQDEAGRPYRFGKLRLQLGL